MHSLHEKLTGALAGHYLVVREVGRGGMATVYLAEDIRHHRKVAVKVLRPELAVILGKPNANAARVAVTRALARLMEQLDES